MPDIAIPKRFPLFLRFVTLPESRQGKVFCKVKRLTVAVLLTCMVRAMTGRNGMMIKLERGVMSRCSQRCRAFYETYSCVQTKICCVNKESILIRMVKEVGYSILKMTRIVSVRNVLSTWCIAARA